MPRDGTFAYSLPPGTDGVTDTTIESSKYNTFVHDVAGEFNSVRPILYGGTGASSAADARAALGVTSGAVQVTNYDSHVFETGSFWSLATATAAPVASKMSGHAVIIEDANTITLDAVDNATGLLWTRHKTGGAWSAWAKQDASDRVLRTGDTMTGPLNITADLTLQRAGAPTTAAIFFGNTGSHYLYHDGATYTFAGGALSVSGAVTAPAFNGPLNGNVNGNVSGSSGSCTGNAASATVAASCSGNAASSSSCSGNAATASYAA